MLILGMGLVAILSILAILAIVLGLTRNDPLFVMVGILLLVSALLVFMMFKNNLTNPFKD
ncbi:hypothetical protein F7P73_15090 [Acinetobacter bohemicus]|jgi:hypothetical protein|uniref:Uncharacterized protein n=1 Tax=Acinetobacter bohemicus TaxID=1435036 RepID=A0A1I6QNX6_9GAMM|nr:hypothetical protein [Acinetobacter bohemicus]KAB0650952.1 hypothetical protein F7P73_15090 [Acinetobacter bohemicus]SFS54094.1 hypothetical protein SAMN05444586_1004150 [Acinetobacter bohemicus]